MAYPNVFLYSETKERLKKLKRKYHESLDETVTRLINYYETKEGIKTHTASIVTGEEYNKLIMLRRDYQAAEGAIGQCFPHVPDSMYKEMSKNHKEYTDYKEELETKYGIEIR